MKVRILQKPSKRLAFIGICVLVPLIAAIVIMSTYGYVKSYAASSYENPFETETAIKEIFKGNYVLYKNLHEKVTGESVQYSDIYLTDLKKILGNSYTEYDTEELAGMEQAFDRVLQYHVENGFLNLLQYFDYYAEDTVTGTTISNTAIAMSAEKDSYFYYLEVLYDANGSAVIADAKSESSERLMKNASECILTKNQLLQDWLESSNYGRFRYDAGFNFLQYGDGPKNCRIIYGVKQSAWQEYTNSRMNYDPYSVRSNVYYAYANSGIMEYITLAYLAVALLAVILPLNRLVNKPFCENRYTNLPVEVAAGAALFIVSFTSEFLVGIIRLLEGNAASDIESFLKISASAANLLAYWVHLILLFLLFLTAWYLGLSVRPLREKGLKKYIKENSLIYRIFPFCKRQMLKVYRGLEHIDVTKKAGRTILKVVIVNAIILFIISSMWYGGFAITIVYSIVLYFLLKFYVSRMQKKYSILLEKIQEISAGNLHVEIQEDLGIFEPFKEQLLSIQTGFRSAVEEEVKSQKMKSELITNVSHDLKTPLTAIITYVDLLKDENITEEQRKEYLDTLERKSLRLKVLIEDLFEVSKATSGNITLNYMDVDICNLVKQVQVEMADKLAEAGLDVRMDFPEEKVIVSLDSQKTYRIYENLFQNIAKYSLKGTRVYVQGTLVKDAKTPGGFTEDRIIISLKNISATEITVDMAQLTERFVRGDVSRNTEGSGLGLAIVKSFVELQGGRLVLESDGDLFKAITSFPCKR